MINIKYINSTRSKKRINSNRFIYEKISKSIIDSLDLIKIRFENILEIGINENTTFEYLSKKFNNSKFLRVDSNEINILNKNKYEFFKQNIDQWNLEKDKYDLIFSNCYSFISNSLEETFR